MAGDDSRRIAEITLDEHTVVRRGPEIEDERAAAIADLLKANRFAPVSGCRGPYRVHLATAEDRLNLDIRSTADGSRETVVLPLKPFRSVIKDYFLVCESYFAAIRKGGLAQIEALDAGRRSLHDEGSALLRERLAERIEIDHDTARRLFTLICVLHLRG